MELPAGSPAIDAGSCEQATDQRGIARPQGIACDIGAYERESGLLSDLSITKTDGSTTYTPGGTAVYTVTVSNAGPSAVTNATVTDNLPSGVASWTWACTSQNGGASGCTGAAAGNSNFTDTVDLPVGGSIVYTVTANISGTMTANLVDIASIAPPNGTTDPNPNNDSATDTDARAQQAVAIPALSHVGFGVLALMLAFAAMFVLRRSAV